MRVAYIVGWPYGQDSGPYKKIVAQAELWAQHGAEVALFVLTEAPYGEEWRRVPGAAEVIERSRSPFKLAGQKERLVGAALRWRPTVLYHRYSLPYPGLLRAARRVPLVVEINTDDRREYDLLSPAKGLLNRALRGSLLANAAGLVFVTSELATSPGFAKFSKPSVVIANGIRLESIPPQDAPANPTPNLAFLGQPGCPWHGVDKVLALARARPQWRFDLVGPGPSDVPQRSANVTAHGRMTAGDYQAVLRRADVGIGSLAMHRNGLQEASTLKVREYLASGIPVILAYDDTDFPGDEPFLLRLANREDNIDDALDVIDEFVQKWRGRRVPREAIVHLDVTEKEKRRLEFMASRAAASAGG